MNTVIKYLVTQISNNDIHNLLQVPKWFWKDWLEFIQILFPGPPEQRSKLLCHSIMFIGILILADFNPYISGGPQCWATPIWKAGVLTYIYKKYVCSTYLDYPTQTTAIFLGWIDNFKLTSCCLSSSSPSPTTVIPDAFCAKILQPWRKKLMEIWVSKKMAENPQVPNGTAKQKQPGIFSPRNLNRRFIPWTKPSYLFVGFKWC